MPTYDYFCEQCNHTVEVSQKITDTPLTLCPECHEPTLKRGVGGGGARFQFKGTGFYITDYCKTAGSDCSCKKGDS